VGQGDGVSANAKSMIRVGSAVSRREHISNAWALKICRFPELADSRVSKREEKEALKICRFRGTIQKSRGKNFERKSGKGRRALDHYQNTLSLYLKAISHFYFSKRHILNAPIFLL
jgi:hypothetical protein